MGNSKRILEGDGRGRGKATKAAPKALADQAAEEVPAPSFESALERLEVSVARLEEGEMPLEEALELFESGVKLSRQCQTTLEQAERRIEILAADRGLQLGNEEEGVVDFEVEVDADDESASEG